MSHLARPALSRHQHSSGGDGTPAGFIDGCSSAPWFDGWSRPRSLAFVAKAKADDTGPPVVPARTWLLRVAWRRDGPLDVDDAPLSSYSTPQAR